MNRVFGSDQGAQPGGRIAQLNRMAITQMKSLLSINDMQKRLENKND